MNQNTYPGAYAALEQQAEEYVGRAQIDDIIGYGQESDYAECEAQYSGNGGATLSSYAVGDEGVYPGPNAAAGAFDTGGMGMQDPTENEQVRMGMRDLLQERASKRQAASEMFQGRAKQFAGG